MNKFIEQVGNICSLVYVGSECLLHFPTNQQAWEHLSSLMTVDNGPDDWPQEVYIALTLSDRAGVRVPQIGHVTSEKNELKYKELWGDEFTDFRDRVIADWPRIKEAVKC